MCGRLNIHDNEHIREFLHELGLPVYPAAPPRYNVTPGSTLPVLIPHDHVAEFVPMEWSIQFGKFRHPNTRAATIARKPWLQTLLMQNRCIIPANRFYEWPDLKARPTFKKEKTRFCIHTPEDVMFLGGLYKINQDGVMQFNILTTEPSAAINEFHHRMPVMIPPDQLRHWLQTQQKQDLYEMMTPWQGELVLYECDAWVDNGRHDDARCMQRAGE